MWVWEFFPIKKIIIKNIFILGQKSQKIANNKRQFELKTACFYVFKEKKKNQNQTYYNMSKKSTKNSIISREKAEI